MTFVIVWAVWLPTVDNGFVWDDRANILANPHVRGLSWSNLTWMFGSSLLGHYQPLTWLSFSFDYALWGLSPGGYHLTNLLLHGLNAGLFLLFAFRLLRIAVPASSTAGQRRTCRSLYRRARQRRRRAER